MNVRNFIFWIHFVSGVVGGAVILLMSATGVPLAFEKEIISWFERDARRLPAESAGERLSHEELLKRLNAARPDFKPGTLTVFPEPASAVLAAQGRANAVYVDPWSGEIHREGATGVRSFMQTMMEWHRWLGMEGEGRDVGKAITGACNAAFVVLGVTGIFLWFPRRWTRAAVRAIALFKPGLRGRARDWNWHNVIGIWCGPVLIVLAATAMPISYVWASNLVYRLAGSEPPAQGGAGQGGAAQGAQGPREGGQGRRRAEATASTAPSVSLDVVIASVQERFPEWEQLMIRTGGGRGGPSASAAPAVGASLALTVYERGRWPRFASRQVTLDPASGEVLKAESYADQSAGRRARMWTRFLHTGEALGPAGQAIAGIASLGGVVLAWTGFALAWRRLLGRPKRSSEDSLPAANSRPPEPATANASEP